MSSTIPSMILRTRDVFPESIALETGDASQQYTYRDITTDADTWSRSLTALLPVGERIGVMMDGGVDLSRWILSVLWRHTVVPLRPDSSADDVRRYLTLTRTRLLIATAQAERVRSICDQLGIVVISPEQALATPPADPSSCPMPTADTVAVVLLTSGSSGTPKVVPLTHCNLVTSTRDMARALHLSETDRCLVQWSQYHIGGLVDHLLVPLSTGGTIINGGSFTVDTMRTLLRTARPTWTQFVPASLDETIRDSERRADPLVPNTLRFIRCVAAPMNEELWERAEAALGCPLLHAYGMTEAAPLVTATPFGKVPRVPGSTGRSVGPDIRIVDDQDRPVAPGMIGAIHVRGANVFGGYEGNDELNTATFVDGWFRTGDLGRLDDQGELFVLGREKNMINRGGEKINPIEIEDVLRRHPKVTDAAVFGLPHRRLGHVVVAAVSTSTTIQPDELMDFAGSTLSPHKIPAQILVFDQLPRLSVGKVDLEGLRRMALEESTRPSLTYRNRTERVIAEIWSDQLGVENLSPSVAFTVVGGDSLSAVQVVAEVERAFAVHHHTTRLLAARTIREMATMIEELIEVGDAVPVSGAQQLSRRSRWNNRLNIDDFAHRIMFASPGPEREVEQHLTLTHLCPEEFAPLFEVLRRNDAGIVDSLSVLHQLGPSGDDARRSGSPWSRTALHDAVSLYQRQVSTPHTTTVVACASNGFRMFLPIHRFLTALPDDVSTVMVVIDPDKLAFRAGIPGIASTITDLGAGLRSLSPGDFECDVRTIGASAGCLAAVIVGLTLGARSSGLAGSDSPRRLPDIDAALRAARRARSTPMVCKAVSGLPRHDLHALRDLGSDIPGIRRRVYPTRRHNVFQSAWDRGLMPWLLRWLLSD